MTKAKTLHNRRDRRKAKASDFAREGTAKPKRHGHHLYTDPFADNRPRTRATRPLPPEPYKTILDEGRATTSLGRLLWHLGRESEQRARLAAAWADELRRAEMREFARDWNEMAGIEDRCRALADRDADAFAAALDRKILSQSAPRPLGGRVVFLPGLPCGNLYAGGRG